MANVVVKTKSMFHSKTFWANTVVLLISIFSEVQALLPAFSDIVSIPAEISRWLLFLTAILNIALRRISDQPARFTSEGGPVVLERYDATQY